MTKTIIFMFFILGLGIGPTQAEIKQSCFGDACITRDKSNTGVRFAINNDNPFPISIEFNVTGENIGADVIFPYTVVIPSKTQQYLFNVTQQQAGRKWQYKYRYKWNVGDVHAVHDDDYRYRVPFATGHVMKTGQSCHGEFSHQNHLAYAIDFVVPEGTPIYAARDGVVGKVKEDSNIGGRDPSYKEHANVVKVVHNDGTVAVYLHLKKDGAVVDLGQQVHRGQLLGYSGNTGYSTAPHLHFAVQRPKVGEKSQTLSFVFDALEGEFTCPERGTLMTVK